MASTTSPHLLLLLLCTLHLLTSIISASEAYPPPYGDTPNSCVSTQSNIDLVPQRREVYGGGRIFDITHRYREDMPAWGSTDGGMGKFIWLSESMKNGSLANISELKMIAHSGTHVDAPGHVFEHYYDAGFDVDSLDLEVLNGPALLVDVPRDTNITAEVMESLHIPKGVQRVLFRTLNTDRRLMWKNYFDTSFVGLTVNGAKWLVENTDIKFVGFQASSCSRPSRLPASLPAGPAGPASFQQAQQAFQQAFQQASSRPSRLPAAAAGFQQSRLPADPVPSRTRLGWDEVGMRFFPSRPVPIPYERDGIGMGISRPIPSRAHP